MSEMNLGLHHSGRLFQVRGPATPNE